MSIDAMLKAAEAGDLDGIRAQPGLAGSADRDGTTPLHEAAGNGHLHIVEWLVGQGVDGKLPRLARQDAAAPRHQLAAYRSTGRAPAGKPREPMTAPAPP
jgi:hypothetical protein